MTLPPPRPPRKIDPEDLIREIEDDPLTQFVWSIRPRTLCAIRKLAAMFRRLLWRSPIETTRQCVDPT